MVNTTPKTQIQANKKEYILHTQTIIKSRYLTQVMGFKMMYDIEKNPTIYLTKNSKTMIIEYCESTDLYNFKSHKLTKDLDVIPLNDLTGLYVDSLLELIEEFAKTKIYGLF